MAQAVSSRFDIRYSCSAASLAAVLCLQSLCKVLIIRGALLRIVILCVLIAKVGVVVVSEGNGWDVCGCLDMG